MDCNFNFNQLQTHCLHDHDTSTSQTTDRQAEWLWQTTWLGKYTALRYASRGIKRSHVRSVLLLDSRPYCLLLFVA